MKFDQGPLILVNLRPPVLVKLILILQFFFQETRATRINVALILLDRSFSISFFATLFRIITQK